MPVWEEPHKPNAATLVTTTAITSEGIYNVRLKCLSLKSTTTNCHCHWSKSDPPVHHNEFQCSYSYLYSQLPIKGIVSFKKCIHSICKPKPTQTGLALFDKITFEDWSGYLNLWKSIQSKPFLNIIASVNTWNNFWSCAQDGSVQCPFSNLFDSSQLSGHLSDVCIIVIFFYLSVLSVFGSTFCIL